MNQPSKNSADMGIHADAIHSLAEQYNIDEKKVKGIYQAELSKLEVGTRITAFLPVLCIRHVKELIIRSRHG
jgi:hypothetical protein